MSRLKRADMCKILHFNQLFYNELMEQLYKQFSLVSQSDQLINDRNEDVYYYCYNYWCCYK